MLNQLIFIRGVRNINFTHIHHFNLLAYNATLIISITCLFNGRIPNTGNTHVHDAGRISESENPNHCKIRASSRGVLPLSCLLAT